MNENTRAQVVYSLVNWGSSSRPVVTNCLLADVAMRSVTTSVGSLLCYATVPHRTSTLRAQCLSSAAATSPQPIGNERKLPQHNAHHILRETFACGSVNMPTHRIRLSVRHQQIILHNPFIVIFIKKTDIFINHFKLDA